MSKIIRAPRVAQRQMVCALKSLHITGFKHVLPAIEPGRSLAGASVAIVPGPDSRAAKCARSRHDHAVRLSTPPSLSLPVRNERCR
jgi:hypothetical protein